jgi:hypothetical protein
VDGIPNEERDADQVRIVRDPRRIGAAVGKEGAGISIA